MSRKTIGLLLIIVGLLGTAVSLLADVIYLGSYWGINWAQITGAGVGVVVFLVGLWLRLKKEKVKS